MDIKPIEQAVQQGVQGIVEKIKAQIEQQVVAEVLNALGAGPKKEPEAKPKRKRAGTTTKDKSAKKRPYRKCREHGCRKAAKGPTYFWACADHAEKYRTAREAEGKPTRRSRRKAAAETQEPISGATDANGRFHAAEDLPEPLRSEIAAHNAGLNGSGARADD